MNIKNMKDKTKKKLLQIIWDECSFDEIINAGLDIGACSSSDIINVASEYDDPNKEYDLEEVISECSLEDIIYELKREYGVDDLVEAIGEDDILDELDNDEMLDRLKDTFTLDNYIDECKDDWYRFEYEELEKEFEYNVKQIKDDLTPETPDEWHEFLCDIIGCSYYDNENFNLGLKNILDNLGKSSYVKRNS